MEGSESAGEVTGEPEHADSRARWVDADFGALEEEEGAFAGDGEATEGEEDFGAGGDSQSDGPGKVEVEGGHHGKGEDEKAGEARVADETAGNGDGEKAEGGGEQWWQEKGGDDGEGE